MFSLNRIYFLFVFLLVSSSLFLQAAKMTSTSNLITLSEVNAMDQDEFVEKFSNIIEHLPLIAASLVHKRPFSSVDHFHQLISSFLDQLPQEGLFLFRISQNWLVNDTVI